MQANEVLHNGAKVAYGVAGSGPAVVLVHGFGEDGHIWQHQVQSLQKAFKVIVPHLPGSATSGLQHDMSMEGLADSVAGVITTAAAGGTLFYRCGFNQLLQGYDGQTRPHTCIKANNPAGTVCTR